MQKVKSLPTGNTAITTYRLSTDTLAELDAVAREHGLDSRTAAIRFLARKEAKKILGKSGK